MTHDRDATGSSFRASTSSTSFSFLSLYIRSQTLMPTSNPTPSASAPRPPSDREHDSSNDPPGPRSTPPNQSSSTRPHHLLPPLVPPPPQGSPSDPNQAGPSKPGGPLFANELLDPQLLGHREPSQRTTNPVPERCLTFCSQRQDSQPLCRMFCLRRRRAVMSQREELDKLRSNYHHDETNMKNPSKEGSGIWNPFKALERRFAPWSFIYIKGTPEGVVGRYMEELEGDDGNRDFGSVSRGASDLQRRKAGDGMEYIDWGEHGYVSLSVRRGYFPLDG